MHFRGSLGEVGCLQPLQSPPRVEGQGRNPPVSKCILCNSETWNSSPAWPMSRELLAEWGPPWGHCWAVSEIGVCVPDPGLVQVTSGSLFWCPCWGFFVFFCSSYCST